MRLLIIAQFMNNAIRATTANVLAAMGKIRINMIVSFIGLGLQILFDILLIPRFGGYAVAFIGIANFSFMGLTLFLVFAKQYRLFKKD